MDPEKRLFVVHKYFSVELQIIFLRAFVWMFRPERLRIVQCNRALVDLYLLFGRRYFNHLLLTVLIFLLFHLGFFVNMLYHHVIIAKIRLVNSLIFLFGIRLGYINRNRHKGTVFLQYFSCPVFISKFQTVFIQEQGYLRTHAFFASI